MSDYFNRRLVLGLFVSCLLALMAGGAYSGVMAQTQSLHTRPFFHTHNVGNLASMARDQFGTSVAISGTTAVVGAAFEDINGNEDQGAVYVYTWNGLDWVQQGSPLTASNGAAGDNFGISVAVDGDTLAVGAWSANLGETNAGAVYIFTRNGTTWTPQAELTAGEAGDGFGRAVALDADTVAIGAPFTKIGGNNNQGAAYLYSWNGMDWVQQGSRLTASSGTAGELFGHAAALDGRRVLIGAYRADVNGKTDQGAAYVYSWNSTSWQQEGGALTAVGGESGDLFGFSVALSGLTAFVGAVRDDVGANRDQGSVYVFRWQNSAWSQQGGALTAEVGKAGDNFGYAVALENNTAIVGAPGSDVFGSNSGIVSVFVQQGTTWSQQADTAYVFDGAGSVIGRSVALSGDRALVGAPGFDRLGVQDTGIVHVLVRSARAWQDRLLTIPTSVAGDRFGESVAIDGDTAFVGAPGAGNGQGKVYVFTNLAAGGLEIAQLTVNNSAGFGKSLILDGNMAVIGATGAHHVFARTGTTWGFHSTLSGTPVMALDGNAARVMVQSSPVSILAFDGTSWVVESELPDPEGSFNFGKSGALEGSIAMVGAPGTSLENDLQPDGAVYVYVRDGGTWQLEEPPLVGDHCNFCTNQFGFPIVSDENEFLIGAVSDDSVSGDRGAVYSYIRSGTTWLPFERLVTSDNIETFLFGYPLAFGGDTALIGGGEGRKTFAFLRDSGGWVEAGALPLVGPMDVDGNIAIIGIPDENDGKGAVHIFIMQ